MELDEQMRLLEQTPIMPPTIQLARTVAVRQPQRNYGGVRRLLLRCRRCFENAKPRFLGEFEVPIRDLNSRHFATVHTFSSAPSRVFSSNRQRASAAAGVHQFHEAAHVKVSDNNIVVKLTRRRAIFR